MIVCDNLGSHLNGNVIVKYKKEEEGIKAMGILSNQYYKGRPIMIDYSPATDFNKSICKLNERFVCDRGGYCNYFHLKYISKKFRQTLFDQMYYEHPEYIDRGSNDNKAKRLYKSKRSGSKCSSVDSNISEIGIYDSPNRRKALKKWELKYLKYENEANTKKENIEEGLVNAYKDIINRRDKSRSNI
jgi:splicing factor U2AF subunit